MEYLKGTVSQPNVEFLPCVIKVLLENVLREGRGEESELLVRVGCAAGIATAVHKNDASVVLLGEREEPCENR